VTSSAARAFVVLFPDGSETVAESDNIGTFPRRGDEVAPGWIAEKVEIRDGRREDVSVDGEPVYVEVTVVARDEFVD